MNDRIYHNPFYLCFCNGYCACGALTDFVKPLQKVIDFVKPKKVYEWGPGTSTKVLLKSDASTVVSVEHNKQWIPFIADDRWDCFLVDLDSPDYSSIKGAEDCDLYMVDGRKRSSCIESIYHNAKNDAVACLHDAQRSRYDEAIRLFPYVVFLTRSFCVMSKNPFVLKLRE